MASLDEVSVDQIVLLLRCSKAFQFTLKKFGPGNMSRFSPELKLESLFRKLMIRDYVQSLKDIPILRHQWINAAKEEDGFQRSGFYPFVRIKAQNRWLTFDGILVTNGIKSLKLFYLHKRERVTKLDSFLAPSEYKILQLQDVEQLDHFHLVTSKSDDYSGFHEESIDKRIEFHLRNKIRPLVEQAQKIGKLRQLLPIIPGGQCRIHSEDECPYSIPCLKEDVKQVPIQRNNLLRFKTLASRDKYDLIKRDIWFADELPLSLQLKRNEQIVHDCEGKNRRHIEPAKVRAWLEKQGLRLKDLKTPLIFLDFEAYNFPYRIAPESDGHGYLPFQYSYYIQYPGTKSAESADRIFTDFSHDIRRQFCDQLLRDIMPAVNRQGKVVVYNKSFEDQRLKELGERFPDSSDSLTRISAALVDLAEPFRRFYVYLPGQLGSYSLKAILAPLMVLWPRHAKRLISKNYSELAIKGGMASVRGYTLLAWMRRTQEQSIHSENRIKILQQKLIDYCQLDTHCMVDILQVLNSIAEVDEINIRESNN